MVTQNDTQNTDITLNETARGSENFLRWSTSAMLRGGRVTKFKGIAASYSPELGLVSSGPGAVAGGGRGSTTLSLARRLLRWSAAPVALLAAQSPAFAQDACVEGAPNNFICEDNGGPATDEQDLSGDGGDVVVTIEDGFEVDTTVAGDDGINIQGANSVVIAQSSGSSSIIGGGYGIDAYGIVNGIDITTGGQVTGLGSDGIYANNETSGDVVIDSRAGAVSGGSGGIDARNSGTGSTSITTADVTGEDDDGIYATSSGDALSIDSSAGVVTGQSDGIEARNYGTGATTITTADVTGVDFGIRATNDVSATDITIDTRAGAVLATDSEIGGGIVAINNGTGNTTIVTADVTAEGYGGEGGSGIDVTHAASAADINIDSSLGSVTGHINGIDVRNNGAGNIAITTASVTGETANGVDIYNGIDGGELVLDTSAGPVEGAQNGIRVRNYANEQNATITTADVTGLAEDGINVRDDGEIGNGADITINSAAGTVTGAQDGIEAFNFDTGDLSITTGNVDGEAGNGIDATNQGVGTGNLTIDSSLGAVTGGANGIDVANSGTGATTITTGNVTGESGFGVNVQAYNDAGPITIDTSAGTVNAASYGIVTGSVSAQITVISAQVNAPGGDGILINTGPQSAGVSVDSSAGAVTGSDDGISVFDGGYGDTTITTGDVTGEGGNGIFVNSSAMSTGLTINSTAGVVTGARYGINASNAGTGDIVITAAAVTGNDGSEGNAITARNSNASGGAVEINTIAGAVTGGDRGIYASNDGLGGIAITTADVTTLYSGEYGQGIDASDRGAGSLSIDTTAGAVAAVQEGIVARNDGGGALSITTANVTSANNEGIDASTFNSDGDATINTVAGAVLGGTDGINLSNDGTGNAFVTTADVTGSYGNGIQVYGGEGGEGILSVDSTAGTVTGTFDAGILVTDDGGAAISITTADVAGLANGSGEGGFGIQAFGNNSGTGDITIDTRLGAVSGAVSGIEVRSVGIGAVSVTTAAVSSANGDGIYVRSEGESITVDSSAGAIVSDDGGIEIRNVGSGSTSVTTGAITNADGQGIYVYNYAGSTDVTIDSTAGEVSTDGTGVYVRNYGSGDTSITTADVSSTGSSDGVYAYGGFGSGSLAIDTSAGAVSGGDDGVEAYHYGSGTLTITTADVTGSGEGVNSDGIRARSDDADIIVDSSLGTVTGTQNGINASNYGGESLSITAAGVTGQNAAGIRARNYGEDLTINSIAGGVTGQQNGIDARNEGVGVTSITTANVTGTTANGVLVAHYGTDLVINSSAGAVTGEVDGIDASNNGTGAATIITANVTALTESSPGGVGIVASNAASATDLTINSSAGIVDATFNGIITRNEGTGSTQITTADVVARQGSGEGPGIGIFASNGAAAQDLVIDSSAGSITSNSTGIYANNRGAGSLSITSGAIASTVSNGIFTRNRGTDLIIDATAGAVTADNTGINATNYGSGATTIITASITATNGDGIDVETRGTDLTIDTTAGAVVAGDDGIYVQNEGTGSTTITTGDVTAGGDYGIRVYSYGTDLIIDTTAGTITSAGDDAIYAKNYGIGEVVVTTAALTGDDYGVYAYNSGEGTNLTIDTRAGAVFGDFEGIEGGNEGSGALTIITADVTGAGDEGIEAFNDGTDLTINTSYGSVLGEGSGIFARNRGSGFLSITTADVTGEEQHGIEVENNDGTDLIINTVAGSVTGGENGILAENSGTGALSITTANVTGTGADYNGIEAINEGTDLVIDSSAGAVTGAQDGIVATQNGTGSTTIMTAAVTGADGNGINATNGTGSGALVIDTSAGSVSGSTYGITADNYGTGDTTVTTSDVTGFFAVAAVGREASGDLTIDTAQGAVSGVAFGVRGTSRSTGALSVTTGDVTSADYTSTAVSATGDGAFITVDTTAGSVLGGAGGVAGFNRSGVGETLSITTGDVTTVASYGGGGSAVFGYADNGDVIIDTTAGTLTGLVDGVFGGTQNGSLTITTADVDAATGSGITADVANGDVSIDSTAGSIDAATSGIAVEHEGTGNVSIATANVTAAGGDGVSMVTDVDTAALAIDTSAGAIIGANRGIFADHQGSDDLTITVGNVTGQTAEGILASTTQAGADIFVQGGEGVESNVVGATNGIGLTTQGANITVTGLDSVTGQNGDGLNLVSSGGDIAVSDIGTITGLGGNGIFANSDSGNISIQNVGLVGGITATGGVGIAAYADNGGTITIGTSGEVSGETYGVDGSASGDVTIDTTNYGVTGAIGIRAVNSGAGATSVTTADVTGTGGEGITASTTGTDVTVNTLAGTVTGVTDGIVAANTGTGEIAVTTADVTGTTGDGITASNAASAAGLAIDTTAGTVTGGQNGIAADHDGTGDLILTTADIIGQAGDGIAADNNAGSATIIDTSEGSVTGGQDGIDVSNYGPGDLSITTAAVTGEAGRGVSASNDAEDGDLVINTVAGAVSGSSEGIEAFQSGYGTGSLSITTANVEGGQAGVNASNYANDLSIDTTAGSVTGGSDGIYASNVSSSQGNMSIITGDVTGVAGSGISATEYGEGSGSTGADIVIDSALGTVTGGTNGVYARNLDTGDLTITTANVEGSSGLGIDALNTAGTGDLVINSAAGTVSGAISGILARNEGTGLTSVVAADVTGTDGAGIDASTAASAGDLSIDSSAGSVSGGQNGIAALNNGSGSLSVTAANVTGGTGAGISAINAASGIDLAIDSSAGTATGATAGVFADQLSAGGVTMLVDQVTGGVGIDSNATSGNTVITLGSTAVVTGTSGFGIDARSTGGNVTVQGSSGSVIGATDGIYVRPTTGDITISTIDLVEGQAGDGLDLLTQGGNITVSDIGAIIGAGGNGVAANAGGGAIDVQTAGDITGSIAGVAATTTGAGTIAINVGGATSGTQSGLDVSTEGGAVTITNSGSLSGGDFAVLASGPATGSIALDNSGTLSTAIQFAAADDSFANSGTFAAAGTSDFGDGDDTLVNTGTIAVTGAVQFDRLETLQSGGTLSLADGAATGTFTTSGDFLGTGGDVVLDVDFATSSADQLIIGGAATGTTTLALNAISSGFIFNQEFVIVQAGEGTEATAFVLGDGQQITPFLNADLSFDAVANTFSFEVALSERVFEGTKIAENAQALWYRSTDAWADHRANSRANAGLGAVTGEGTPVWVVAYGASAKRDENFRDAAGLVLNEAQLDYTQDFFGLQGGADYALGDALTLGVTGGFLNSSARQDANGNRINFDTLNIGLSASYTAGAFFADALVKFDSISGDLSDPTGSGFNGTLDGQAFGLRAQAGYRFGDASFYVEPNAAFDLQKTDLDDLVIEGQTFVFDNVNGARGTAGIRFGGESKTGSGAAIGYYLGANMVHEFDGKADVRFIINGGEIGFQNNPIDTYGNLEAGISVDNGGPLSGFLQVESDLSKDYQSFGGKVGVRLKF